MPAASVLPLLKYSSSSQHPWLPTSHAPLETHLDSMAPGARATFATSKATPQSAKLPLKGKSFSESATLLVSLQEGCYGWYSHPPATSSKEVGTTRAASAEWAMQRKTQYVDRTATDVFHLPIRLTMLPSRLAHPPILPYGRPYYCHSPFSGTDYTGTDVLHLEYRRLSCSSLISRHLSPML